MKNDRLILSLLKSGRLTVEPKTGLVFLDGRRKGWVKSTGYVVFEYTSRGRRRIISCHRVVWIAANGIPGHDMEVDHVDGDKTDNRLAKLELVTGATNVRRAYANGLCSTKTNHNYRDPWSGKFVRDLAAAPF